MVFFVHPAQKVPVFGLNKPFLWWTKVDTVDKMKSGKEQMLDKTYINRLKKVTYTDPSSMKYGLTPRDVCCPVCKKVVTKEDPAKLEYIKTKRGTEIFIHTGCVEKWSK